MKSFKVLKGSHFEGNKEYTADGPPVPSDRDLHAIFPGKFAEGEEVVGEGIDTSATTGPGAVSEFGINVTDRFPGAVEGGLQVHAKGSKHFVVDPDKPHEALNDKGLKSTEVEDFIADLLKG